MRWIGRPDVRVHPLRHASMGGRAAGRDHTWGQDEFNRDQTKLGQPSRSVVGAHHEISDAPSRISQMEQAVSSAPVSGRFSSAEEESLARVMWSVDQAQSGEFFAVEGPVAGLAEVRLRLQGQHTVRQYGPLALPELAQRPVTADAGTVVWIEAASPDALNVWIDWLRTRRDSLRKGGPRAIVLAAPEGLAELIARRAPDLATVLQLPVRVGVPQFQRPAMPVAWLHVSDLHLRATDWRQNLVLSHLVRDLPKLLAESVGKVDLLFCTGDISQSGKPEEFLAAHQALTELVQAAGLTFDRLHVVPGNHDVDRRQINTSAQLMQKALLAQAKDSDLNDFDALLGDPDQVGILGARLGAYAAFSRQLLGVARGVDPGRPWRVDEHEIGGLSIGVASLCSVLISGNDRENRDLLLGERQVREAAGYLRRCQLKVALLHHPIAWLAEAEQVAMDELLASEFQVVLHGHRHQSGTAAVSRGAAPSATSAAGALYTASKYPNQFQVGKFDPSTGQLDLRYFAYSPRGGGYWHPDPSGGRAAASGRQQLQLAALTAQAQPAGADFGLAERLCRAAVRVLEPISFVGIPIAVHRPAARLEDIFIAQTLRLGARAGFAAIQAGADIEFDELRIAITTEENHARFPGKRVVVVAGPGMGKSTLCQYLAYKAAQAGRVPVLLRLRDFRPEAQVGLVEFSAKRFSRHYCVPTNAEELHALAAVGRLAVFIDGFDEVAREGLRADIRDAVVALADRWPKVPVLCTTRPVGYDRAPLPGQFVQLALRPLAPQGIDMFVDRWYTLALPNEPALRLERVADLQGALRRLPAAQELASVPLLATLIALVHRYSATLPGSRARLMEKVIETLLDAWPAEQRRQFGELSVEQQRRLLERIALHRRSHSNRFQTSATFTLDEAADSAAGELADSRVPREFAEKRRLAERWLRWLVEGSGVLVEGSPQVLEFMHLSLGEYLAGQCLLADRAGGDSRTLANQLLAMSELAHMQQIGLYAAAVALGQRRDLGQALLEAATRAATCVRWVQLLDLVQEGVLVGDGAIAAIVGGLLETSQGGTAATTMRSGKCLDAIVSHQLPGHIAVVRACCDYVCRVDGRLDTNVLAVLEAAPLLAGPCGQALGEAKDGALVAVTKLDWPDWALPALKNLRAAEIAAYGQRLCPNDRGALLATAPKVVGEAPRVALPWLLADAQWQQFLYLRATIGGALAIGTAQDRSICALDPPLAILIGESPHLPALQAVLHGLSSEGGENSPAIYGWTLGFEDDRQLRTVEIELSLTGGAVQHARWVPSDSPAAQVLPNHPALNRRELRSLAAYACALQLHSGAQRLRLIQEPFEPVAYYGQPLLWQCLPHILAIGTWPTADGTEPPNLLPPQPPWAILYYYRLCQWAMDPANDERRRAVDAVIDSYVGPDPDLPPLLRQWRIVALGTPEYEAARTDLLAKGEALMQQDPAKSPRRRKKT